MEEISSDVSECPESSASSFISNFRDFWSLDDELRQSADSGPDHTSEDQVVEYDDARVRTQGYACEQWIIRGLKHGVRIRRQPHISHLFTIGTAQTSRKRFVEEVTWIDLHSRERKIPPGGGLPRQELLHIFSHQLCLRLGYVSVAYRRHSRKGIKARRHRTRCSEWYTIDMFHDVTASKDSLRSIARTLSTKYLQSCDA